jgi:hypothetical protein
MKVDLTELKESREDQKRFGGERERFLVRTWRVTAESRGRVVWERRKME